MSSQKNREPENDLPPGLAMPALRALVAAGYTRLDQLTQIKEADLRRLHGIGPKAIDLLRSALNARGQSFASPDSAQRRVNLWALSDLCTPWCIHVVATLRIADHIAAGVGQIGDLAAAAGCDPYALHRVLTYLVGKGVFEEPVPGRFALNETARQLLDPSQRIGLDLNGIGGRMAYAWGTLLKYVRTGKPAYHEIFGLTFWEDLHAHPEIAASFDALIGPAGHGTPNPEFQITGGWETVRTVVDVGGGTGAMLAQILRRWPHLHGTLVDQPGTVARSEEIFKAASVTERVTTVGQSFFDPLPAGADLYLMKGVLNDWPDREAAAILGRCAEAARPTGWVVVLGGVVPDGAPMSLMIEMVLVGGKYRTVSEMRQLAQEAGLEVVAAGQQPSHFVVECRPSAPGNGDQLSGDHMSLH